jgi:hypothetical protein
MSVIDQPPASPPRLGQEPRDLDGLLRAFFRAEMPEPWPAPQAPPGNQHRVSRSLWRGRLALAASVALLLLVSLWLGRNVGEREPPTLPVNPGSIIGKSVRPNPSRPAPTGRLLRSEQSQNPNRKRGQSH